MPFRNHSGVASKAAACAIAAMHLRQLPVAAIGYLGVEVVHVRSDRLRISRQGR
jgi:hypothetical protein